MPSVADMNGRKGPFKRWYKMEGAQWHGIRDVVLADNPKCSRCGSKDADVVDHIEPVRDGVYNPDADRYETSGGVWIHDFTNLRPSCRPCNLKGRDCRGRKFKQSWLDDSVAKDALAARVQAMRASGMRRCEVMVALGQTPAQHTRLLRRTLDSDGRSARTRELLEERRKRVTIYTGAVSTKRKRENNMNPEIRRRFCRRLLARHRVCESCGEREAVHVDHIFPFKLSVRQDAVTGKFLTADGLDMDDESNLQCLCSECHRAKTSEDSSGKRSVRIVGANDLGSAMLGDAKSRKAQALRSYGGSVLVIARIMGVSNGCVGRWLRNRLDRNGHGVTARRLIRRWRKERPNEGLPVVDYDWSVSAEEIAEARSHPCNLLCGYLHARDREVLLQYRAEGMTRAAVCRVMGITEWRYNQLRVLEANVANNERMWRDAHAHIPFPRLALL